LWAVPNKEIRILGIASHARFKFILAIYFVCPVFAPHATLFGFHGIEEFAARGKAEVGIGGQLNASKYAK